MKKIAAIFATIALIAILAQASIAQGNKKSNPNDIGNRRVAHRSIISLENEVAIGKKLSDQIDRQAKLVKDPIISEYVNRVAQNIARNSDLKVPLTVKVIDAPGINAFALPGGFLYVNSGTLLALDNESQLAGIIGHEIAHVACRHWASQMTKAAILRYTMLPVMILSGGMSYPIYVGTMEAMNYGIPIAFLKFSRDDEAEADYFGLQYLLKAGYDPESYISVFSKVIEEERKDPGSAPKVFMDHPPTPDRIIKIDAEMKSFPPKSEYLVSTSEFDDMKARLAEIMTNKKKAEKQEGKPALERRQSGETDTVQGKGTDKKNKKDDDKPPILRRRDGGDN